MGLLARISRGFLRGNKAVCHWLTKRGFVQRDTALNDHLREYVEGLLAAQSELRILEVGGSSRPFLPKGSGTEYVGLDIDQVVSNTGVYDRWMIRSVEDPIPGTYDFVFSAYLLEHVPDNRSSVANMSNCLETGGHLICLFPCGFHPYSMATRLVGHRLQKWLIRMLRPESLGRTGYPVHFDHCTPKAFGKLLEQNGMVVEKRIVAWGASNYFDFFVPFFLAIKLFNRIAQLFRLQLFSSGMLVHARKMAVVGVPAAGDTGAALRVQAAGSDPALPESPAETPVRSAN